MRLGLLQRYNKPPDIPLTTLAMISLAREVGFIREILDAIVVPRSKVSEIGQLLCSNQKISKISLQARQQLESN